LSEEKASPANRLNAREATPEELKFDEIDSEIMLTPAAQSTATERKIFLEHPAISLKRNVSAIDVTIRPII